MHLKLPFHRHQPTTTNMAAAASFSASSSLSSLFSSKFNPHYRPSQPIYSPSRSLKISSKSNQENPTKLPTNQNPSPATAPETVPEKRSFAVATGELFMGIASRMINAGGSGKGREGEKKAPAQEVLMFSDTENEAAPESSSWWWRRRNKEKISSVIEDPVQPEVVWEQTEKDVEAEKRRKAVTSPGFSFSAAGLLFPYHLGVAQFLIEKGYIKETTPLAGSSAGAIVCAVIASGASMQEALQATKLLAEDCRAKGTAFRLGAVLRDILEKFLPDDVHIRSNGRVRVAVTQILWRPRGLLVDQFDSKEDLINAVFTSSFIPGYLAPRPATMFRNRLCIDGGLTLFMPPTSAAQTIRVCAFPTSRLGLEGIGISPDCNPVNRASPRELFNWALEPAEDEVLDRLFEFGYSDAAVWAKENPVEQLVRDEKRSSEVE